MRMKSYKITTRLLCFALTALFVLSYIPFGYVKAEASQDVLSVAVEDKTVPTSIDTTIRCDAYSCSHSDQWVPMFPTGAPDNSGTWPDWTFGINYAAVERNGYRDLGSLHLVSSPGKNTGIAINAGMTVGQRYTLGMYVKGTSNSGRVLALYANGDSAIIGECSQLTSDWSYYEITFTASISQLNVMAVDWGNTDLYIDNISLKNRFGIDLLSGYGDFYHSTQVPVTYEPYGVYTTKVADAYNCRYTDYWVTMYPAGSPDGTWSAWDYSHYAEVVADGYADCGALHMVSQIGKNTGIAITPGLILGQTYTLGMWVKGTTNNPNKVLALYGNEDTVIIGDPQYSPNGVVGSTAITEDWSYVEVSFTATFRQLNLMVVDWGSSDVYIDNITLKDSTGTDILSGSGDFYRVKSTAVEDANLNFEYNASGMPFNWTHKGVLADSSAELYAENVYSGNRALRVHRQNGQLDYSFLYSQSLIPVSYGDEVELVANLASRNSISGSFSMYVLGMDKAADGQMIDFAYGQERITNAGSDWSQWDTYSLTYTVPEGVSYLQFCLRVGGTEADVLIDDLQYYNYTENKQTIYQEDFEEPSVITGLAGGWEREAVSGTATAQCDGKLMISGDTASNMQTVTRLYTLRTDYNYELTVDVHTEPGVSGKLVLEAVNWKGERTGEAVNLNLNTSGANRQLKYEFRALSAVYYRLIVQKVSGNGSVCVDNLSLRVTKTPTKTGSSGNTGDISGPAPEALTTTSSVESIGGKTYMIVNGEPVVPIWYARPENPDLFEAHTITKYADVGVDTVVTYVFLNNYYGDVWTKEGFVSDAIDSMMQANLTGNPNAKFIVTLDFNAPAWWQEENPGELSALANTSPDKTGASFASEKWKQESGSIMLQAVEYMMQQPYANQIIGFKVTGGYTLEWNWWGTSGIVDDVGDFSQCGIAAFRAWLTEKYGTDSVLQQAYGDNSITLANAMPPSAALRSDDYLDTVITVQDHQQMMDYELYMAQLKADTIEYFAKLVKDATQDRLIVGTYAGYFFPGGGYEFTTAVANVYFQKLLQSEYVDFIKSPWMYGMREIGDSAEFMGPVDSLDLYGKLWIIEDDTRLNLQKMLGKQDDNAAVGWTRDYQQSVEQLKRNFSYILSKGMGISFYNLVWNFTDDDQYYGVVGQMYAQMKESLCLVSESTADIAVFVDGESHMLIPYEEESANSILYSSVYREQLEELGHIGAPYDLYLLDDLKDGLVPEYKINIFLATTLITEEERAAIENQLQKNGNILVWIFTDGISDGEKTDVTLMEDIIGMDLSVVSTERRHNATAKISNTSHWLTQGMNQNQPYGVETYGKMSPVIAVTDRTATSLAYHTGSSYTALAVKDMGDWTSVYSAVPNLPQILFRNMLRQIQGHVYTDSGSDVIYANSDYVALHSLFAGERTIRLPEAATVYDVFQERILATNTDTFTVTLTGKETRLFRLSQQSEVLASIDRGTMTGAYTALANVWTPMYPAGSPDSGSWEAWNENHYGEIVEDGYLNPGSLHLVSYYYKNTGVAIHAGMTPGQSYTLGLWAKGTTNSGRVLALYANGDPVIIQTPDALTTDWTYYEITFTAALGQINLMAADWGETDIYIDNITLKDTEGNDLLSGNGDFWSMTECEEHNWIAANCTQPQKCFACKAVSGEVLGHSYGDWIITEPTTLKSDGQMESRCALCGDIRTQIIPCLAGDVEGWSLTLGGDLRMNFKMRIHSDIRDTGRVIISVAADSYSYMVSEGTYDEVSDCFLFTVPVAAAQMGDTITVQIVNGEDASVTKTYSVLQYAQTILADGNMQNYHSLVRAMLHYGAAAQAHFQYNVENLVNAGVKDESTDAVPETWEPKQTTEGETEGVSFYGASLVFEHQTAVRFYFTVSGEIEDYMFRSGDREFAPISKGEYWYVELPGINPQDLDETLVITVSDGLTVSYSPMNYMVRMYKNGSDSLKTLLQAMYHYHLEAERFVAQ